MLTLVLIIALTNFRIISGVEDDNKFINSLPEKQKKEFLHKVETRIHNEVPEVKSPEGNDTNVDLYEKRLEDQSKSVQNILRSEIDSIKNSQRRSTNESERQYAHIDLTLRAQHDKTKARRENEGVTKSVLLENIPVAVQYDSESVINPKSNSNNKNDTESDVITWINTNNVTKIADVINNSTERKRIGRRSNDFKLENITLANSDVNSDTNAVEDTTIVLTSAQDVAITNSSVDVPVTSEKPSTQYVEDTTLLEISTLAENNSETVQDSSTIKNKDLEKNEILTLKNINAKSDDPDGSTTQHDGIPLRGDILGVTTLFNANPHNINISMAPFNHENSTTISNVINTTDAIKDVKGVTNTHVTTDHVIRSTISNKVTTITINSTNSTTTDNISDLDNEHNTQHGVIINDHHDTTRNNVNDTEEQLYITNLTNTSENNGLITDMFRGNLKLNIAKTHSHNSGTDSKNGGTDDNVPNKTLGIFQHDTIISHNKNPFDARSLDALDSRIVNVIGNTDSQKGTKNIGNNELNNFTTSTVVTESSFKPTHKVSGYVSVFSNHKSNKKSKHSVLSQTLTTDTVKNSRDTTNGLSSHGPSNATDSESQAKYVPVYNYDPENAYFHPTIGRPLAENIVENVVRSYPFVIKKTEKHTKTTSLDFIEDGNKKSLRIKDIKERITSASNAKNNTGMYGMVSGDESIESSKDDDVHEKPLKHNLKKIREKLHTYHINDNKDIETNPDINESEVKTEYKNEVRKTYGSFSDKHAEKSISELFKNFGVLLENLVVQANKIEDISEPKKNSNIEKQSDGSIYMDVANSLERHNKVIRNKGIQKLVENLEKIQKRLEEKRRKKPNSKHAKNYQSRFKVKNRDGKREQTQDEKVSILDHFERLIADEDENIIGNAKPTKTEDYLETHLNILKDLVDANDEGLQTYDWLGTTVLIQAGLDKIYDITERRIRNENLHPLDEQLLEYCMKLHERAINLIAEENERTMPRKRLSFHIPKPRKGKYFNVLKRMYGEMTKAKTISLIRSKYSIEDFKEFLIDLGTSLYDLHTAIKQISNITTYKKQRWFKNIKQLYLNSAGDKEYLGLLLHFVSARIVGLIDDRAKFEVDFMKKDQETERIEVEFVMAVKICNELIRLNN